MVHVMDEDITLDRLATQFLEEHRRWLNPSIEAYQEQYSHLSSQIEELFPVLLAMEQWKGIKEIDQNQKHFQIPIKDEILGDIRIVQEIGRGEMSIVYSARQEHLGRDVAVKILPCHHRNAKRMRERFEREARMVGRLQHRNIVSIFNYGESEKYCYYVMQMVQGAGMDWVIDRLSNYENKIHPDEFNYALNPKLNSQNHPRKSNQVLHERELGRDSWRSFACIAFQAIKAIQYAHGQGTLHNNIKPTNILLDKDGHVWVNDFSLAQYQINESSQDEQGFSCMIRYMAPERFKSISDERSDLYSIGAVLYELCTLTPVVEAGSFNQVIDQVLNQEVIRPSEINPLIPGMLEGIILKSISKNPDERYSSAKEMGRELLRFINSLSKTDDV